MKINDFPEHIRDSLIPSPTGDMVYKCLKCESEHDSGKLLYTCPRCGGVLMLHNKNTETIDSTPWGKWREIFDYRRMLNVTALRGIFRYYEFIAPIIPLDKIVYLGEAHTPMIAANKRLTDRLGVRFYFKNDGLNPSASFKDRGMACAFSYINHMAHANHIDRILAICASTGDTSASAALYAAYLEDSVASAVLLPKGKVTPQQLSQPLGSGAVVIQIPGVFDDCMKVVEELAETYHVALLNSKNSWRILGQESFSYEICQDFDYEVADKAILVPIGNAGNITAIMSGFLKFYKAGIIDELPKIVGVQSSHADPVFRYYADDNPERIFKPVSVKASVAQAAMIGNPVSMPRVVNLAEEYNRLAGKRRVFVVQVTEQEIMDAMITANRNGNIACTQGGESMAGLAAACSRGIIDPEDIAVLDSTAHVLKFSMFQDMYFSDRFDPAFEVTPDSTLKNEPLDIVPDGLKAYPAPDSPLDGELLQEFVKATADSVAGLLKLTPRS
jgi:threonine synthase